MKQIFSILLIFISIGVNAQSTPEKMVDQFFMLYEKGELVNAVDYIFSTNKLMIENESMSGQINNVKTQLTNTVPKLGKYYGYEVVKTKNIGTTMIAYTYLVKYERIPLRFNFIFYKASDTWAINNFSFDNNLDELIRDN